MKADSYRDKGLRERMVDDLQAKGIEDTHVLQAMRKVPRHWFVPAGMEEQAYEDRPLSIGSEQTISQPYTVAYQSQLLCVQKGLKVLEIGTGSGYQTAVLCALGATVYTIERQRSLFLTAKALFRDIPYHPHCYLGDGYQGLVEVDYSPYDRILITCGAPMVPPALLAQLKLGGIMVIPVGADRNQKMLRITKTDEDNFRVERFDSCGFVPMLEDVNYTTHRKRSAHLNPNQYNPTV